MSPIIPALISICDLVVGYNYNNMLSMLKNETFELSVVFILSLVTSYIFITPLLIVLNKFVSHLKKFRFIVIFTALSVAIYILLIFIFSLPSILSISTIIHQSIVGLLIGLFTSILFCWLSSITRPSI